MWQLMSMNTDLCVRHAVRESTPHTRGFHRLSKRLLKQWFEKITTSKVHFVERELHNPDFSGTLMAMEGFAELTQEEFKKWNSSRKQA